MNLNQTGCSIKMVQIFCCGEEIKDHEDGVNGTDFYICFKCKTGYNIGFCEVDEDGEVLN